MRIEKIKIAELSQDPANARKHSDKNIDSIVASLRRFGQQKPIVVDASGVVRAGNGTLQAAMVLGWETIDAVCTELKGSEATAFAIADNRTAELAEWDEEILLASLQVLDSDLLTATGFSEDDLSGLLGDEVDPADVFEDECPAKPSEPISRQGDIWCLGEHRVGCGSCLDIAFLQKVFDGAMADMLFTDPPYNVSYQGGTSEKLTIKNDSMSDEDFLQFLRDAFSGLATVVSPGGAAYVCHADSEGRNFRQAFSESGFELKQCLIWVKNTLVLGRQDYQWRHEPILYGWRSGGGTQVLWKQKADNSD